MKYVLAILRSPVVWTLGWILRALQIEVSWKPRWPRCSADSRSAAKSGDMTRSWPWFFASTMQTCAVTRWPSHRGRGSSRRQHYIFIPRVTHGSAILRNRNGLLPPDVGRHGPTPAYPGYLRTCRRIRSWHDCNCWRDNCRAPFALVLRGFISPLLWMTCPARTRWTATFAVTRLSQGTAVVRSRKRSHRKRSPRHWPTCIRNNTKGKNNGRASPAPIPDDRIRIRQCSQLPKLH